MDRSTASMTQEMGIDEREILRRKAFLEFRGEDEQALQALNEVAERYADPVIEDLEEWVRMGAPDPRLTNTRAAVQAKEAIDWD